MRILLQLEGYCYIDNVLENDHTKYQKSFDYDKNKSKVDEKLNLIKSKLPLNTTVRVKVPKEKLLKRSHQSNLSDTIYLINGFKRPLKFSEDIGIYLSDLKGKDVSGIFYYKQLKLIPNQTYKKVHKIITFLKKKKAIRWAINLKHFDNFGGGYPRAMEYCFLWLQCIFS